METKTVKASKEIGERVKKRRRELGMSQERLAEIMDVTYQQVQRYENGMNRLNVENIQVIADALTVSISYFFEDAKEENMVAEDPSLYLSTEEHKLLRYFRKIKNSNSKSVVIQVARLVAVDKKKRKSKEKT